MRDMSDTDLPRLRARLMQWLLTNALPTWWDIGADRTGGGFHEAIDLAGRPVLGERRARVQARQIFSYVVGGSLGWSGPWQQAVDHGLDYFLGRYRRADGLFWNALASDGRPVEKAPHLYEQAFALLALATAAGANAASTTANRALEPVAVTIVERLLAERRCPHGGYTGFVDEAVRGGGREQRRKAAFIYRSGKIDRDVSGDDQHPVGLEVQRVRRSLLLKQLVYSDGNSGFFIGEEKRLERKSRTASQVE